MKGPSRIAVPVLAALAMLFVAGCGGGTLFDRLGGSLGYGICGLVIVILDIIALVEIAGANWSVGRKVIWALVIIFFPVLGLLLYWIFAREAGS